MNIAIASKNPVKIEAAKTAFSQVFSQGLEVFSFDMPSGVPDQPMSYEQTREGAYNRVVNTIAHCKQQLSEGKGKAKGDKDADGEQRYVSEPVDYYIAYEGGVDVFEDGPKTFAVLCISNGEEFVFGQSATLPLPMNIYQELLAGVELGDAMDALFSTHNIKQKGGAIGQLTSGLETRMSIYQSATILALSYFAKPDIYI